MNPSKTFGPIDPGVDIGHVHLKVADLERALAFYTGVLGFDLTQRYGDSAAEGGRPVCGSTTWSPRA